MKLKLVNLNYLKVSMLINKNKLFLTISLFMAVPTKAETILFDLWGVLFGTPWTAYAKSMALPAICYTICDRKNPLKFGQLFLDTLAEVPVEEKDGEKEEKINSMASTYRLMPKVMYRWQKGKLSYQKALESSKKYINDLDPKKHSVREKGLLIMSAETCFDLETRKKRIKPLYKGIAILKRCADEKNSEGSKKHKLKVVSNMDHEMIEYLKEAYPDVFNLFDEIIYSAKVDCLKPDEGIYKAAIDKDDDIKNYILIDDQEENTKGFEKLGAKSILCKDFSKVSKELEDLKIISPLKASWIPSKSTTLLALTAIATGTYYFFKD